MGVGAFLAATTPATADTLAHRAPELGVGKGITDIELGLRLRYEFSREFAPYICVHWERKIGETARLAREEGEHPDSLFVVAGLRFWF